MALLSGGKGPDADQRRDAGAFERPLVGAARVHPSGRFVYSANRGHDTITVFRVDQQTGELTVVERENVRGATPRNFNLDPSGQWLLAAGQSSHTLASFEVDQETGELSYTGSNVIAPSAICVLFAHE